MTFVEVVRFVLCHFADTVLVELNIKGGGGLGQFESHSGRPGGFLSLRYLFGPAFNLFKSRT